MLKRFLASVGLAAVLTATVVGGVFAAQSVTVPIAAQNNSGISGTATLTAMGSQTQVVLSLTGEPAGGSEPAHIHTGTCTNLGGVKYPLVSVVNGASTTTVNAPLTTLTSGGYAINVHESAANISHYVACGNIPTMPAAAPSTGEGGLAATNAAVPLAGALALGLAAVALQRRPSADTNA